MRITDRQFDALGFWIRAEIAAALCHKSAGPHVRAAQEHANYAALKARAALVGKLSPEMVAAVDSHTLRENRA